MVLPLILAMTAAEMSAVSSLPSKVAYMACHFSPYTQGLANLPEKLPEGSVLILNDRMPCRGHSPQLAAEQLSRTSERLCCESVLLDFQRPSDPESLAMAAAILEALPCPAAATPEYASKNCAVFLPPAPLHTDLTEYLHPWQGQEIWLEAALCQEVATVTESGCAFHTVFPVDGLEGGFYDKTLCCHYRTEIHSDQIRFTLFDTRSSLETKLKKAHSLGVTKAVGLYQELGM